MAARKKRTQKKKGSLLKKYGPFLEGLCNIPQRYRQKTVNDCPKEILDCVGECCLNLLKGNVKLTKAQKEQLRSRRNHIRLLSTKRVTVTNKKKILNQKGGALLGLLLKPLLGSVLGSILSR